jgi:hypothetical protein
MLNRYSLALALLCLTALPLQARDAPIKLYDASLYSQVVTECDRLAAHGEDPDKVAPGVSEAKVDLPVAIAACRADVTRDPGNPRLLYQLGRALAYAGEIDESLPILERSVALAYPQAQFVLGYLLLDGRLKAPVDRCRALELFRLSAAQQRMAAQIGLAVWQLDGHFRKCANPPRRRELLGLLEAARAQKPKFYPELLISDLERQLGVRR